MVTSDNQGIQFLPPWNSHWVQMLVSCPLQDQARANERQALMVALLQELDPEVQRPQ